MKVLSIGIDLSDITQTQLATTKDSVSNHADLVHVGSLEGTIQHKQSTMLSMVKVMDQIIRSQAIAIYISQSNKHPGAVRHVLPA